MAHITYITGGQRSGKSSYAQKLAEKQSNSPVYLATARVWDEDFKQRIDRHKSDRNESWQTIEIEKAIHEYDFTSRTVVLDCITLWLTNIYTDLHYNATETLSQAKTIWDSLINQESNLIVISNELGMGMHAETEIGRKFTDIQGFMNQYIAQNANIAICMISGLPLQLK